MNKKGSMEDKIIDRDKICKKREPDCKTEKNSYIINVERDRVKKEKGRRVVNKNRI